MAGRRSGNGGGGFNIPGIITTILIILALICASVIVVRDGAWNRVVSALGASLNQVDGVEGLKPSGSDYDSLGLHITLPKPQANPNNDSWQNLQPNTNTGSNGWQLQANPNGTTNGNSGVDESTGLPAAATSPITYQQAAQIAQDITVETPHPAGYDREKDFGTWINSDKMCGTATTRDYILARDLVNTTQDAKTCKIKTGVLHDPYTGTDVNFKYGRSTSADVQIDHVVALNDAWASGLWKPDREKDRVAYANDPEVLLASQGDANNRKSEGINLYSKGVPNRYKTVWKDTGQQRWQYSTPSVWLPSNQTYQCAYMAKRVYIKNKYKLSMSKWEKAETVSFLQGCAA
ncbi:GmrSD restriction endonuclease domain-containing protein [Bifidobacterium callitrichidarum]|uniref:HNH endonuclease n=1 Tax=Bifidobacterium callitrichidarum TaxID=2052941 RepID=A0A2U2NC69_9BIFI|nr:DUF1524 domain-containing protein [Bifidobacterium callitrichidarum]PWG66680.1 HNH endonuclease [Bifidobacterium callitrichidarum]